MLSKILEFNKLYYYSCHLILWDTIRAMGYYGLTIVWRVHSIISKQLKTASVSLKRPNLHFFISTFFLLPWEVLIK